jgi:uncharacterized protein
MNLQSALQLADWRRQTTALYARVRDQADPVTAHALWRDGRDQLMRSHPQSPLSAADPMRADGVPYWPYDPAMRWTVPVEPVPQPQRLVIDTGPDGLTRLEQIGWVTLPDPVGRRLALWQLDQYAGGLFLPLRDATAGTTSYGGGRYLLDTAKGADLGSVGDQALVIDLNFLYHPSCRYDARWVCPLAPKDNTIDVPIPAGERLAPDRVQASSYLACSGHSGLSFSLGRGGLAGWLLTGAAGPGRVGCCPPARPGFPGSLLVLCS